MQTANPYATPNAPVDDIHSNEGTGDINIFTSRSRLGRLRYFYYSMLLGIIGMVLIILAASVMAISPIIGGILIAVLYIAMLVLSFFLLIQRCHDLDKSGWWSLAIFIPFAFLYFYFAPGTKSSNRFGLKPPVNSKSVIFGSIILPILMIVIMGVLSSIAAPAYSDYLERARAAQDSNNIEQAQ